MTEHVQIQVVLCLVWGLNLCTKTQTNKPQDKTEVSFRRPKDPEQTQRHVWLDGECSHWSSNTAVIWFQHQLVQFSDALRVSEAFRSSLMTADKASGLMPCSHSLTHMERDSMSKPVFSNLEISSSTSIVSRTAFRFAFAALAMVMDKKLATMLASNTPRGVSRNTSKAMSSFTQTFHARCSF